MFALLAALLATFLTDYRYAESGLEEINPMVRRAMDSDYLANDFFTNTTDDFGPRFYYARLIAGIATPASLPVVYFLLTLLINAAIAVGTGLFARELFRTGVAGLFAVALTMGASTFKLGGAGWAHANEPNSYWMGFPFALCAVWAAARARPVLAGLSAGLVAVLHPTFGATVGGVVFLSLVFALWDRRRREGTRIPVAGVVIGILVFAVLVGLVAVPYSGGARIPDEQLFEIMLFRAPHHLVPSTFPADDWIQSVLFLATLGVAWRWLRGESLPDRFAANVLTAAAATLLLSFVGGYLFVEVWPWKPWFVAIPYRSTSFLMWLGWVVIGGSAARRIFDRSKFGEGFLLQLSCFNTVSSGLAHLGSALIEKRSIGRTAAVVGGIVALSLGIAFTEWRDLTQFLIINGLALWFVLGPDRVWAASIGVGAPIALAAGLLTYQSLVHAPGPIDRIGPEILPSHIEGDEADIARAARDLTPADAVILTPARFGSFRVLADRAIVVDMRAIPYQEDAMVEWMDRIVSIYGMPSATGFESEDLGQDGGDQVDETYKIIDDETIRALCDLYPITYAVLFAETPTAAPVIAANDTYRLVALEDCG